MIEFVQPSGRDAWRALRKRPTDCRSPSDSKRSEPDGPSGLPPPPSPAPPESEDDFVSQFSRHPRCVRLSVDCAATVVLSRAAPDKIIRPETKSCNLIGLSHTYQVTGRVLLGRRCSLRETRSIGAARYAMNHSSRLRSGTCLMSHP